MDYIDIALQAATVVILAFYAIILFKSRINPKIVKRAALIITLAGTGLFMYGYQTEGYVEGVVSLFLRGLISAIKMFLYENSVFETLAAQKQSPYFLDLFVLVYYSAMLTSFSAIILLFGKRLMTFLTLAFSRKTYRHVFFGVNKNSEMIARGIKNEEIVFVEFPDDGDGEEVSLSSIIKHMTKDDHGGGILDAKHITLLRAKRRLAQRDTDEGVLEQIGLGRLQKRIDEKTSFYLLSDNGEKNLQELMVVVSDERLRHHTVHACVKREGLAQTFHGVLGKTGAHLIYPSSLSVVDLMKSPDCHPVNVMNVNMSEDGSCDGTVSGEFNALVIGFGETGQAATKFVYEFASAIRRDGSPLPVHIYVNDSNLERLKGQFVFSCPELEHDDIFSYENNGLDSGEFWRTLLSRLDILNYIVVSMGNDTANLDLACTIYTYAEKKRRDGFRNLRIYVRKKNTPEYEKRLVERLNEKAGMEVIRCFGEHDKVFTPEMIVSKNATGINVKATTQADRLKARFDEITRSSACGEALAGGAAGGSLEGAGTCLAGGSLEGAAASLAGGSRESVGAGADATTYHDKRRIRRDMHQLISSANHISTKMMMAGWESDVDEHTLENLAMCEHLRYARYLKAHGYSYDAEDDDVMKTNHQLCSWSELPEQDKQYHRHMVQASLQLPE